MSSQPQRIRIILPNGPAKKSSTINHHPSTELFELNAAAEHARAAIQHPASSNKHRPLHVVQKGSIILPVYRDADGYYNGKYYVAGQRKSVRRAKLEDIKEFLALQATRLANGEIEAANLTSSDRATLQRVREILAPFGLSPELAAATIARLLSNLKRAGIEVALDAIVDDYIARATRKQIVPVKCPELVDKYLEARRLNTFGKRRARGRWLRTLSSQLDSFKEYFQCDIRQVFAENLDAWLDKIKASGRTRKGYATAVACMVKYAKAKNHLPEDWTEHKRVTMTEPGRIKKAVLEPEQMIKLLYIAESHQFRRKLIYQKWIPFLTIGGFAGIRHEEMNPTDKPPLDWKDIDFKNRQIRISEETNKNPVERFIKMPDNLVKWLLPYSRRSGPVCPEGKTSAIICRLKKLAGIPTGKNETRNTLRKSWVSYSNALQAAKEVAEQGGHSQAVMRYNYQKAIREVEKADRWFNISPLETQGALPLTYLAIA